MSGREKLVKPDPRIYNLLLTRHGVDPNRAAYIDDVRANAEAATALGIHGIHFRSPDQLRGELQSIGLL